MRRGSPFVGDSRLNTTLTYCSIVPPARDGIEVHGAARVRILLFTGHHGQLYTTWLTTNVHDAARARHFLVTGHRGHRHISAGQAEPENTKNKVDSSTCNCR
ncbi:hypothetical protein ACLKA7_001202 [Drosophila subpalustris]